MSYCLILPAHGSPAPNGQALFQRLAEALAAVIAEQAGEAPRD
ncbi:hypothetical protein [Halomonas sp. NO4]|nr:hypothetical protein [Halomonas sp. NO4]